MWDFAKWASPHSSKGQSRAGCQALQVTRSSPWPGVKIPQSGQIDCVPTKYILCNQIYSILALGICTDLVSQVDANIFK